MCVNCSIGHLIHRFHICFLSFDCHLSSHFFKLFFLFLSKLAWLSQYFSLFLATAIWSVSSLWVCFLSDFYFIIAILLSLESSCISFIFPLITSIFSAWLPLQMCSFKEAKSSYMFFCILLVQYWHFRLMLERTSFL